MSWRWPRDDLKRRRLRRRVYFATIWLAIGAVVNVLVAWGCVWHAESKRHIHTITKSREPSYPYEWIVMPWPSSVPASWPPPTLRVSRSSRGYLHEFARNIHWMVKVKREEPKGDGVPGSMEEYRLNTFIQRKFPLNERRTGMAARSSLFDPNLIEDPDVDGFVVKYEQRGILRECFHANAGWPLFSIQSHSIQSIVSDIGNHLLTGQIGIGPHIDYESPRCFLNRIGGGIIADSLLPASASGPRKWTLPIMPIWPGFAINTVLYAGIGWLMVRGFISFSMFVIRHRRRRRHLCVGCAYPIAGLTTCPECELHISIKTSGSPAPAATILP